MTKTTNNNSSKQWDSIWEPQDLVLALFSIISAILFIFSPKKLTYVYTCHKKDNVAPANSKSSHMISFFVWNTRFMFSTWKIFHLSPQPVWAALAKYHRPGGLQPTEIDFSQYWRLRHPRSRCQQIWCGVCWGTTSQFRLSSFSLSAHEGRGYVLSGVSFVRALILFLGAPPSWPKYLPKVLLTNTITSAG